ncbi:MAG: LacI family transcriptional regulator [Candidatus Omnitrophica bacterium]|nr:LacI family transcriptional regulator [Candidatus Omnitrophota bacterium]MCM8807761.1 LacI family transcriptional regulator [Candidatus Omnitrophota bacterium]
MKRLKDIAQELGVSVATVSYVYNNKWKEKRINEKLVQKIKKKIKESNYKPNPLGLQLKTGKTQTIGIILGDLTRSFNLNILSGIEKKLAENNYFALISSSNLGEKEIQHIETFLERKIEGLIISPQKSENYEKLVKIFEKSKIPVVFVDNYLSDKNIDFVVSDNKWGSFKATEYLIKKGKRKIAYIGSEKNLSALNERFDGYCECLKKYGFKIDERLIYKKIEKQEDMYEGLEDIFKKVKPDAIFVESLLYFKYGFKFFYENGIKIPDDIFLTGFDPVDLNLSEIAEVHFNLVVKGLIPFIEQRGEDIGKKAAEIILKKIKNKNKKIWKVFIKPELKNFK